MWARSACINEECSTRPSPASSGARRLVQQRIDSGLRDGFVDFRCRAARSEAADRLSVHLNRQVALIRKHLGKNQHLQIASLELIGGVLRRGPYSAAHRAFFLGELKRNHARAIPLL
jgi:hypothetical protein